jgi:hypothetical protein
LAARLNDPTHAYWADAENGQYVCVALRTFNAFTGFWRTTEVFTAPIPTPGNNPIFFDLATLYPSDCGYSVLDRNVLIELENNLLEPVTTNWTQPWPGTAQFSYDKLIYALERRRDQWLLETGQVVTWLDDVPAPGVPGGRVHLPSNTIAIRRAAWVDENNYESVLHRADGWSLNAFAATWPLSPTMTPSAYSVNPVPPLQLLIGPKTQATGRLRLLTVQTGAALNPLGPGAGVLMGIPDDWSWAIRFGALADLLSESGPSQDASRASYSEARWEEAVKLATGTSRVLGASLGGQQIPVVALSEADSFQAGWPNWEVNPTQRPAAIGVSGLNLIAPVPTCGVGLLGRPYSFTLDVAQNAPLPVNDGDEVQLPGEMIDPLLDYSVHLASFKMGGAEFSQTQALQHTFYRACGIEIGKAKAEAPDRDLINAASAREESAMPRSA